jgi:hypothetical protein
MGDNLPAAWAAKEKLWSLSRNAVVHEDGLVNQRLTWLINLHGFLIAGFAGLQGGLFANKCKIDCVTIVVVEIFFVVVFLFAIQMCIRVAASVESAFEHLRHIKEWWYHIYPEERMPPRDAVKFTVLPVPNKIDCPLPYGYESKRFPPIMGDFGFRFNSGISMVPFVFLYLDIVIIIFSAMCGVLLTFNRANTGHLWVQALIPAGVTTIGAGVLVYLYRLIGNVSWFRWILFGAFFFFTWSILAVMIWYVTLPKSEA